MEQRAVAVFADHKCFYGARGIGVAFQQQDMPANLYGTRGILKDNGLMAMWPWPFVPEMTNNRHYYKTNPNLLMERVMLKRYTIGGHEIGVSLDRGLVRITNDLSLRNLAARDPARNTADLVARIKADYSSLMEEPLKIGSDSMVVEIWAHILIGKWTLALQRFLHLRFIDRFAGFILRRMEVIDCGERARDRNRFVWDLLAPFKGPVAVLMREKKS